jgi:hypothetical protein
MKVKVHPHKTMYDAGSEACISITPMKKHGRAYYMGCVILREAEFVVHASGHERMLKEDQRNVHAWVTGEPIFEAVERYRPDVLDSGRMVQVTYDLAAGRFIASDGTDVTDGKYNAAVVVGKDCFISKEW